MYEKLSKYHSHRHAMLGGRYEDEYVRLFPDEDEEEYATIVLGADETVVPPDDGTTLPTTAVDEVFTETETAPDTAVVTPTTTAPTTTTTTTDQTLVVPEKKFNYMKVVSPLVAGLLSGVVTYSIARTVDVEKRKAVKTAVIMGGFTALGQALGEWLYNKLQDLKAAQAEEEAAAATTTAAATEPSSTSVV